MANRSAWLRATRWGNKRLIDASVGRRLGVAGYRAAVGFNRFLPPPRILLNGPSKSGTHLLSDCLALLPKTMYSGRHFALAEFARSQRPVTDDGADPARPMSLDERTLERFLRRCPQGMFVTAHARFHPRLSQLLADLGYRQLLLLRDPRDIVMSFTRYVVSRPNHHRHQYYTQVLSTDDERIMATITGVPTLSPPLQPMHTTVDSYLPWGAEPSTLVCKFEDLVGPLGQGSAETQVATVQAISQFLQRPIPLDHARAVADKMYSTASLTYRKGAIGDWRNHFSPAHRQTFKARAQGMLMQLGYESGDDW
jgi:hypothetical protein